MRATDLLGRQHHEVKSLLRKAEHAEGNTARRAVLEDLGMLLFVHTQIEEDIFYPAVRAVGTRRAEEVIDEAYEEHHVVSLLLEELPSLDTSDRRFRARISVLAELLDKHLEEEEQVIFPLAQTLGDDELLALGAQMEAAMTAVEEEQTAPQRPHARRGHDHHPHR